MHPTITVIHSVSKGVGLVLIVLKRTIIYQIVLSTVSSEFSNVGEGYCILNHVVGFKLDIYGYFQ